ncbi:hypothetical protein Riv7116_1957 [Rivularia sp. PCC 7116]|nr:hypothetical protein Riv7116_1957 [Rivularia sp. PCC 7116]
MIEQLNQNDTGYKIIECSNITFYLQSKNS